MNRLYEALILIGTLAGAILIGKLFKTQVHKARVQNKPWYAPYLSIPGIIVVLVVILPIVIWILRK